MRLPDLHEGKLPPEMSVGDYWKILDDDGNPITRTHSGKLTESCWRAVVPIGDEDGYAIANLDNHTVREHEDGTISVRPNDGSSNSILVTGLHGKQWHGYIEHGKLVQA